MLSCSGLSPGPKIQFTWRGSFKTIFCQGERRSNHQCSFILFIITLLLNYHPDLELCSTYVQMIVIMFSLFMCKVDGCLSDHPALLIAVMGVNVDYLFLLFCEHQRVFGEVLCCIQLKQPSNLILCLLRQFPHCDSLRSCRNLPQSGHWAPRSPVSFASCRLLQRRVCFQGQCFPVGPLSGSLHQQSALRWWRSTAKPARSFSQSKEVGGS